MADTYTNQLSEYLDGELPEAQRTALEAHVGTCAECATTLDELRQVVARAAALPPRPPAVDLWAGIEPRLLPAHGRVAVFREKVTRRISFTLPQLAAAGIALMVMSGGAVWVMQHGGRTTSLPPVAANTAVVPASLTDPRYDEAIADLEQALNAGRGDLDPATIKILETNLSAIDTAIEQSRAALAADPANVYLNSHLADARQRKLALLRRAASLVGGKS